MTGSYYPSLLKSDGIVNYGATIQAENLTAVCACVEAISGTLASMPVNFYKRSGSSRTEINHPLQELIRNGINRYQSWRDFLESIVASALLRGAGLGEIKTDRRGKISEIIFHRWDNVSPQILKNGRIVFDVTPSFLTSGQYRLLQDEVVWLRDRSDDGVMGVSRLQRAYGAVHASLASQQLVTSMLDNGIFPSGVAQTDEELSAEEIADLQTSLDKLYGGSSNAGKGLVLSGGVKWESISISPADAELLASRRFSTEELSRLYGVPGALIGDLTNSSFNNSENMLRFFTMFTLQNWCVRIQQEFQRTVLEPGIEMSIDLSALLNGDPEVRWKSHKIAADANILDVNEIRQIEGYNPRAA